MQKVNVKLCGLSSLADVGAAVEARATYVGFVFFPMSPRSVTLEQAGGLALATPVGVAKVALTVNADDALLDQLIKVVPLDMLQLHGAESPERVAQVRVRYGLPVMKAIGVAGKEDLSQLALYEGVADQILLDAKPPKNGELPGGNGLSFDWRLIAGRLWTKPWMLAGGLVPGNVAEAVALTGAKQVDVSSGIESAPGVKDAELMRTFVTSAQG